MSLTFRYNRVVKHILRLIWLLVVAGCVLAIGTAADRPRQNLGRTPFVKTAGSKFAVNGKPFYVTGVNDFYLPFATKTETIRVLDDAVALRANVLRIFLHPVIGSLDGTKRTIWDWQHGTPNVHGTYLLYWDTKNNQIAINEGPNGMQKVDFLLAEAKKRNIKLIIAFLDFWKYTGGSQQMRAWYSNRDDNQFFFVDPRTRRDYKTWVMYVLNRINPLTGLQYKNDPNIMAWELMNEGNAEPLSTRYAWVAEMSAFVKAQDHNHLVGSGNANSKLLNLSYDLSIPTIDFGTWHGYPKYFNISVDEFSDLIPRYCEVGAVYHKPVLLEEFGLGRANPEQSAIYAKWLDILAEKKDCAGWLVWQLVTRHDNGEFPVDTHDQFDVRNDDGRLWSVIQAAAQKGAKR